jgi:hypothetical protein
MTPKALEQIQKLKDESHYADVRSRNLYDKGHSSTNKYEKDALYKEANNWSNKRYKLNSKIDEIIRSGFSTGEETSIKKNLGSFKTISSDSSLGSRERTAIGYSKPLKSYVKVNYSAYNSFMRNVRGMGSLAGTKSIHSIKPITKKIYDNISEGIEKKGQLSGGWGQRTRNKRAEPMAEVLGRMF